MPKKFKDPDKQEKTVKNWTASKDNKDADVFYLRRKEELIQSRKNVKGKDLDALFSKVEEAYKPHRLTVKSPRKIDNSQPNLYIKVSTALSIVLNTSFDATFSPAAAKYKKTNEFIRAAYLHSLDPQVTATRQQYFNTAFNTAMFGSGALRTYRRLRQREVYGPDNKTKRKITDTDEVDAECMHPMDYWLDDQMKPGDRWSCQDWLRRKVYSFRQFKQFFPEDLFPDVKYVQKGGDTALHLSSTTVSEKSETQTELPDKIEVYFYENEVLDLYVIEAGNVRFNISPLPLTTSTGAKKLTLSHGLWTLRSTDTPYGIGIWEVIEQDQQLIDMVRDMSIEQLTLSIFSIIFHDGTNKVDEEKLKIEAGKWFKMLNPEKIKQFQLGGPGMETIAFIEKFQKDQDEASGISKVLSGEQLGKTAFEANLNQEAGLRRLKIPANNLREMFEWEASNRVDMIQQVYTIPKMEKLMSKEQIEAYEKEITDKEGVPNVDKFFVNEKDEFFTKGYRELPLDLEEDRDGNFVASKETNFLEATPERLDWRGKIKIKMNSLLVSSETLERQSTMELSKELNPFIMALSQQPASAPYLVPQMKQIILAHKKDPEDWIPAQAIGIYKEALAKMEQQEEMKKKMEENPQAGIPGAGPPQAGGAPQARSTPPNQSPGTAIPTTGTPGSPAPAPNIPKAPTSPIGR